jgi:hypothetical protein
MARNAKLSTASSRPKSRIKEALAITHALETQVLPGVEAAHERKALADEISRIADRLRSGTLGAAKPQGAAQATAINTPEHTGIAAELVRSSEDEKSFTIHFKLWPAPHTERVKPDPWPAVHGGQQLCKTCKRPLP